jgi:membrane-bound ClpP family serine protease
MGLNLPIEPNTVYLLLLLGLWSGVTAAYLPGTGVIELASIGASLGAVFLLAQMPTNWLALLILIVGVAGFLVMPFLSRRFAVLAVGGLALQAIGSLFLFDGLVVSPALVAAVIAVSLLYHRFILLPVLRNQHAHPEWDESETLIGATGRVVRPLNPVGTVQAAGELWTARGDQALEAGDEVVVLRRDGLVLTVESMKRKREEGGDLAAETEGMES